MDEWSRISLFDSYAQGQSEIGAYTIPKGKTGYVLSIELDVDSSKPLDIMFFKRENSNDTTAPYTGVIRAIEHFQAVTNEITINPKSTIGKFPEYTDIGFLATASGGGTQGAIDVDFEILLIDNDLIEYEGGDNMALGIIILIPIFIIGLLLAISFFLDSEKYWALKLGLMMLSFVFVFQTYQLSTIIISEYIGGSVLINTIADHTFIFALVFGAIISIFMIHFIKDIFDMFGSKKHKTGEYE